VHDLLAHIDRGAEAVECLLHRDHGAVDPCTVPTGGREDHPLGAIDGGIL
jgi:hypothetical protein